MVRKRQALAPLPAARAAAVRTASASDPAGRWQAWATELQAKASASLQLRLPDLEWLAARGISAEAASWAGLGWLAQDIRPDRASIGLPPERNGKNNLWVPSGLVIPTLVDGRIHRLRIRRTPQDRERLLPDLKYYQVEGSGRAPYAIEPSGPLRGVVIVEAELDAIACADAHPDVMAVSVQTAAGGVTEALRALIASAPVILLALDADSGDSPAGPKAVRAWMDAHRQARFWPVPSGKDPGDYAAQGDLRSWIEAGLPPKIAAPAAPAAAPAQPEVPAAVVPAIQDQPLPLVDKTLGGEGVRHYILSLPGGVEVDVVNNQALWEQLVAAGRLVFSEWELRRLQAACEGMEADTRAEAVRAAVDAKELFPWAYVCRGEVVA